MASLGYQGKCLSILRSLYFNDSVRINVNGVLTDPLFFKLGVKQGCNLSPILFALYIDELIRALQEGKKGLKLGSEVLSAMAFADDILCLSRTTKGTEDQLKQIVGWCENWGMRISDSKTYVSTLSDETGWKCVGVGN